MKKTFFYLAIASLSFLACSKSDDSNPSVSSEESTTVFYTDTFNIYSTDLKGGSRKLVTSEGPSNSTSNNYIIATVYVPTSNRLAYIYTEKYDQPFFLKTCNLDGSDKKTIKTFPAFTQIGLLKATSDGQIFYTLPGKPFPNQTPSKTFSIKADGTGETEITQQVYASTSDPDLISADGKGVLLNGGYFAVIVNGTFDERNSFNVLTNEEKDQTKIKQLSLSNDASKLTFAQKTATAGQYEIRIKNVVKDAPTSTVLYTLNIPSDASEFTLSLKFVNGTKNILVSYGKFTSPKGSVNDYTNCDLIDAVSGKVTNTWKFMGDEIYNPFTN
ncbi:hypothetical protein A5893_01460 [Pedobacter psychrophilus]|uniref:Uncharacterized protein n=1 Tax=Pedobacter psychrophilus TaxID=1826909 RepID=A0A179DLW8_9SPHI|nr:hypothetical protein [Pedobacter psychrophilus]OAQ41812.1 hypothetical protein A5893_01460 [Pedobacter psychrophilus]